MTGPCTICGQETRTLGFTVFSPEASSSVRICREDLHKVDALATLAREIFDEWEGKIQRFNAERGLGWSRELLNRRFWTLVKCSIANVRFTAMIVEVAQEERTGTYFD